MKIILALMLLLSGGADAAEIHVWTARALATVLAEVGTEFERTTGHTLDVSVGLPSEFVEGKEAGALRRCPACGHPLGGDP